MDYKYKDVDEIISVIGTKIKNGEELNQNFANYISENPLFSILKRGILYSNVRFNIDIVEKEAEKYAGKKVTFTTPGKKKISGEIRSSHGNKGALRVLFEKGMPGQAIGKKVVVQ